MSGGAPLGGRYPWPVFPTGWYALAHSAELPAGALATRHAFGRDLVVFRTPRGALGVLDAFCPHMGAHLGEGGRLEGEAVRCPFHGFRFDAGGSCVGTPYPAGTAPAAVRAAAWPARERNGLVLAWHDAAGRPPDWEVPELGTEGLGPLLTRTLVIKGHPQETTENGVDLGHLAVVHGYRDVSMTRPLRTDGPRLHVGYAFSRDAGVFGRGGSVRVQFELQVHGLGCSVVDAEVPEMGMRTRHYVHATPVDGDRVAMRVGLRLGRLGRPGRVMPLLSLMPRALAEAAVARAALRAFIHDLSQDFRIWEHKRYVDPPALAPGDGPVGRYRQWAGQFYTRPPGLAAGEARA
ncbi:MAG TPA: Rieske 2Fe-2S domain-containing protein [Vicinamibacteria bacterium]|nr:Rieske 2Fe-2S domain-containing protein [Vicinamibacteria bacterium]